MIIQVVNLEVSSEKLEAFLVEISNNVRASLQEPGVVQFDLLQQVDSPLEFLLYEVYHSTADLEAHRSSPHFKRWVEVGVPMLSGKRMRVLYHKLAVPPEVNP